MYLATNSYGFLHYEGVAATVLSVLLRARGVTVKAAQEQHRVTAVTSVLRRGGSERLRGLAMKFLQVFDGGMVG